MQFERHKSLYENSMLKQAGKILSWDHTFTASKHIGLTREDDRFVNQFQNVFLGLNENGQVLTCKFTKTTAASEIIDALKEFKNKFERSDTNFRLTWK